MPGQDSRIDKVLQYHKLKDRKALAGKAGLHQTTLKAVLGGAGRSDSKNKLQNYIFPISLKWIISGRGPEFITDTPGSNLSGLTEQNQQEIKQMFSEILENIKAMTDNLKRLADSAPSVSGDRNRGGG